MGAFGLIDDNNNGWDALHNDGVAAFGGHDIVFESQRCFQPHPVVAGLTAVSVSAVCTFSNAAGWTTIIETDSDAAPPNQPVLVERSVGAGRILVFGDSNTWSDSEITPISDARRHVPAIGTRCR